MGKQPLTFIVVGATGDLARRKLFPALFACFARGYLPPDVRFVGLARTSLDDAAFRLRLADGLKCEELEAGACSLQAGEFLRRCHYRRCAYDSSADFGAVDAWLTGLEGGARANRAIYLAVPPFVFGQTARAMSRSGFLPRGAGEPWTRLVVEKPFGRDRASYDELQRTLAEVCDEAQTFRIDHYLGKEVVQNLLVLRFANEIFEPLWCRTHIQHVHIAWSETLGVAGRAGYFDRYGIVRDVMQNHLMQILSLVAMDRPARLDANAIRDEKVAVLRKMRPLDLDHLVVGQYAPGRRGAPPSSAITDRLAEPGGASSASPALRDATPRGYLDEEGVPAGSLTPTYAATVLQVDSPRWQGVPFLLTAGKGLRRTVTEVRVHFRETEAPLYTGSILGAPNGSGRNELIIRVQPDEKLALRIVSKVPGVGMQLGTTELDLRFREKYPGARIADAYENLLLDVVRGDRSLFIRSDELEAAWDLFTPVLQQLEARQIRPAPYAFGGCAPAAVDALAARHGIPDAQVIDQN
jgi:glucose-6-phosphate 1-dehydrogenase